MRGSSWKYLAWMLLPFVIAAAALEWKGVRRPQLEEEAAPASYSVPQDIPAWSADDTARLLAEFPSYTLPLDRDRFAGHLCAAIGREDPEHTQQLLQAGTDPLWPSSDRQVPFFLAVQLGADDAIPLGGSTCWPADALEPVSKRFASKDATEMRAFLGCQAGFFKLVLVLWPDQLVVAPIEGGFATRCASVTSAAT